MTFVGIIVLVSGIVLLYIGSTNFISSVSSENWIQTPVKIDKLTISENHTFSSGYSYKILTEFAYDWNNRSYTGNRFDFSICRKKEGALIDKDFKEVKFRNPSYGFVNPDNPEESVLVRGISPEPFVMGLAGVPLFLLGSIVLFAIFKQGFTLKTSFVKPIKDSLYLAPFVLLLGWMILTVLICAFLLLFSGGADSFRSAIILISLFASVLAADLWLVAGRGVRMSITARSGGKSAFAVALQGRTIKNLAEKNEFPVVFAQLLRQHHSKADYIYSKSYPIASFPMELTKFDSGEMGYVFSNAEDLGLEKPAGPESISGRSKQTMEQLTSEKKKIIETLRDVLSGNSSREKNAFLRKILSGKSWRTFHDMTLVVSVNYKSRSLIFPVPMPE